MASANYRPDVHRLVEASYRTVPPLQALIDEALTTECPDCAVNVFIQEHETNDGEWELVVAHDETCPWLTAREAES